MSRAFKRPSKIILYLARERYRMIDAVLIFASGLAVDNWKAGLTLAAISLLANLFVNWKMRSYR